jgi:hypothetical protein
MGYPRGEIIQDHGRHDPSAFDTRLSMSDRRVYSYTISPIHSTPLIDTFSFILLPSYQLGNLSLKVFHREKGEKGHSSFLLWF